MNFLVLGCNGMAGHMISLYLKEQGHNVTGFARAESKYVRTIVGDASDYKSVANAIESGKYDTIVNCIGILPNMAENKKANAVYINSYLPHLLAELTFDTDVQVIHISTDCVFSGKRGSYFENDFKDGISFYDRTKALGELDDNKNITLRQSIVGPDINPNGVGLMNWFLQQNKEVYGYTNAIWTGVTTLELAKIVEAAATQRVSGLFNMVPDDSISKYELLLMFNKYIKPNKVRIIPNGNVVVDKSLKRANMDFNYSVPAYENMVLELSEWMNNHTEMYKHYYI